MPAFTPIRLLAGHARLARHPRRNDNHVRIRRSGVIVRNAGQFGVEIHQRGRLENIQHLAFETPSLMSKRTSSSAISLVAITLAQVAPTLPAPTTVTLLILQIYFLKSPYPFASRATGVSADRLCRNRPRRAARSGSAGSVIRIFTIQPLPVRVLVDPVGSVVQRFVEFEDFSADRQERVGNGFHRFDRTEHLVLGQRLADRRDIDKKRYLLIDSVRNR